MWVVNMTTDLCQKGISSCLYIFYRRDEIIEVIKHRFAEKINANLPIYGIDKKDLKDFTTTEKDMKRG
jgi:hypothetical protein